MILVWFVNDSDLAVINDRLDTKRFMKRILPVEFPEAAYQLWAIFFIIVISSTELQLIGIIHLDNLNLRQQNLLQIKNPLLIVRINDLVGICNINIIHSCLGKRKIPRGGKIVAPLKIIELVGISRGNLFRSVGRSGIYNDDLIRETLHTVQTAGEYPFFIFNNHTGADSDHRMSSFV